MKRRNNRNDKPKQPTPYRIERLEQRVLFSADMPFIADGPATPQPEAIQVLTNAQDRALEQDSATPSRFEVVIIDAGTPDYQSIIDDLQQRSDADFAIYLLDADEGGIAQIDAILAQHQDVSAVHLIAHGADGEIKLGADSIDFVDLLADAPTIAGWQDTFTENGDFLIYGCDLAATQGGQHFVDTLAQLTGTEVAASTNLTGAAILGGDWQLEYTTGVVETDLALSSQLQSTYQHTLATYTVSTTADSGAGSLHQAIIDANANPNASPTDPDRIVFDIGTGPQTIMVAAAGLPIIEESVILDATTQPGYSGTPLITLDGSATPPSSGINGITIRANDTTVKGFIVINFADEGIEVDGSTGFGDNNVVQSNWVGIDKDGNVAGITEHGIMVSVDAHNNQIGGTGSNDGNVVAGNGFSGIILRQNADNNIVEGNTVGLKPDGTTLAANGDHGIFIGQSADNNRIGGTAAGAANIIGGNTLDGIRIDGTTDATYTTAVSGTIVQGNYIGTDITGTLNLANGGHGVHILGGAINSLIGGTDEAAGNLIAFNAANGVYVVNGSNNAVIGNDIHSNTAQGINNNNLMTPPVLAGVTKDSANTAIVKGDINLAANTTYRIEFFSDHYIGFLTVTTDGSGYAGFDEQISAIVAGGEQISATATVDLGGGNYGDTSKLGSSVAVMLNNLTAVDDQYTLTEDASLDSNTTWFDGDWSFRRTISFDNSAQAENLTNFPVLIKLDATKIDYAKTHDQGHDLRFFDQNGAQLAHEIESWNEAGTSYVWVHVPQIDASSHTDSILMYYGNATVADSGENSAGVWGEFSATYHLNENPGATGMFADSTGNFDATNSSTTNTAGFIGNAQDFNGTDQHINLGDDRPWINNSSAVTMSIWMNADDVGGYGDLMGISRNDPADTGASRMTLIQNGDNVQVIARTMDDSSDSVSVVTSTSPLVAGQWQQITATVDYASDVDNIRVYVDGKLEQSFSHNFTLDAIPNTDSSHATIGSDEDGVSGFFNGQLDEARISTELRSADWIAAQHASTTDTFTTFSYEQAAPGLLQNDIDLNGDTLTLTELNGSPVSFGNPTALPSGALLTLFTDGSFVYNPNGVYETLTDGDSATDVFTYTVDDGNGNTDVGTVTMTIDGVNDTPATIGISDITLDEDAGQSFVDLNAVFSDIEDPDNALIYTITGNTNPALFDSTPINGAGTLTLDYAANQNGVSDLTIRATDTGGEFVETTFTVTLNAVNDAPVRSAGSVNDLVVVEDSGLTSLGLGAVAYANGGGADESTQTLTYEVVTIPDTNFFGKIFLADGTTQVTTGTYTLSEIQGMQFAPEPNANGGPSFFVYQVKDSGGTGNGGDDTLTETIRLDVTPENDDPVFSSPTTYSIDENLTSVGTVTTTDVDGGAPQYTLVGLVDDSLFSIDINTGDLTFDAAPDFEAPADSGGDNVYNLTVQVNDGNGGVVNQNITVNVNNVNETGASAISDTDGAAEAVDEDANIGDAVGISAYATDTDTGDNILYSLDDNAGGLFTIDTNTGIVTVNGVLDYETSTSLDITVRATSTDTSFTTRTFTIAIGDVNEAPVDLTATATTHGGIDLNSDGGNDTYFVADDGSSILGGLTTVTIETSFSVSTPGADLTPLLSYAAGANDEALALFLKSDGRIWFGADSNGSPIASTVGNYPQLFDGEVHHVGVSWDSATGNVDFYIDGQLIESITGYQTGHSVAAGGQLVFGQDQDSVLGGFRTIDVFSGTLYDVRIFNDIRTPGEIASNYDLTLPNTEPGMLANWTFNDLSATGVIIDAVSGNNLTEQHVSALGFSSSNPELLLAVPEDATNGNVIGTLLGVDADAGDTRSYTLLDDAGGRFAIDGTSGQITLINDALIDFESATSHDITVRVTDSGALTYDEVFTIQVIDVNETPTFTSTPDTSATEDSLYSYTFTTNDVDGDALSFTGIAVPPWLTLVDNGNGTATLSGTPTNAEVGVHSIDVQVSDGSLTANQTFTLTVANVNDDPVFSSPNTFNINENATAVGTVTTTDADGGTPQYTLVGVVDDGLFSIDINTGALTFNSAPDFEAPADAGADNVYNLTVQVNDGNGGVVNQAIAVTVTNVNETGASAISDSDAAPEAVSEDANIGDAVGITAYATDTDTGDNILYSLDDNAGGLFTIDATTGIVTVNGVLDYETDTSLDITVRATSTDTSFTTRTFTIAIGDVNDNPPVVTPGQVFNINEDIAADTFVGTAAATDADSVGTLQNWTITAGNTDGIFVIDGNTGNITIADNTNLNFEANNQYTLTVQVGDGLNTSATQTLIIDINDVNDAPTFTSTPITAAAEDSAYSYTITTNDADGDAVTITDVTLPPWLTLVDNGNGTATLSGTPTNAEVGVHSIDVQVSDGSLTANQTFTLTVANVNDDPVFSSPNTFNINENATAVGTVTTTDADGGTPQYTLVGVVDDGLFSIDINTGELTFDAAPDFEAPADSGGDNVYNLTVQVNDGNGGVVNQNITVNVNNVNETGASAISDTDGAAEAVDEDASIGDAVGITAYANDTDTGDNILYSLDDDASGLFTIDTNTGIVTVNGVLDYETDTSLDITVRATSTDASFTTRTFTIAIGDVNDNPPVVTPGQVFNINEDAAVNDAVGTALATDADTVGTLQNWTITNGNADGVFAIDASTGAITIASTTNLNYESTNQYALTVTVGDGVNTSATQTLIIDINDVNDAPTFTSTPITAAAEDSAYSYTITTNDADGDAVTITDVTLPPWLTLVDNGDGTATLSGTPTNAEVGVHTIDVQVSDGALTSNQSFTLTVANVNDDPVFSSPNTFNINENATAVGTVATTDVDGGTPQYTLVGVVDDGLFSIDTNTGVLTFNSAPNFEAPMDAGADNVYNLTVQVNDGNGGVVNQAIAVTVTNVNETGASAISDSDAAPEAVSEDANIGDAVGITAYATDTDTGDNILYSLDDNAGGLFTIDATTGIVTVNGVLDYETDTSLDITVRATSTDTSFTTRTFTIAIGDVNDNPPVVTPGQVFNINEDIAADTFVGTAAATDADSVGTLQNWTITAGNTDGIFVIDGNTGNITIADNTNLNFEANNQYTLTVQVGDGLNTSATQTLIININDVNEAPATVNLDNTSVDELSDTSLGLPVGILSATDPDSGDTFTFAIVGGLDADVFSLGGAQGNQLVLADGVLDFEVQDTYEVTIRSTDAQGLSIDRTFDIAVNDLNDAPQAMTDTLVTAEDVPLTIDILTDLLSNDLDQDGDQLTVVGITQPAHGIMVNNSDGTWTYSPDANYSGDDQFHYQITDTNGATHQGTVNLVVQAINDAPTLAVPDDVSVGENTTDSQVQIVASDIENDPVTLSISGGADRDAFSIDAQSSTLTFAGTHDFENPSDTNHDNRYEVEILVTDSHGASTSQLVSVTVFNVNEAPDIVTSPLTSTQQSNGVIGSITVGDPDLDDQLTLTITGGAGSANFSIDPNTGEVVQNDATSPGVYSLEVQVTDQQGATSQATLNITVQASAETPGGPGEQDAQFEASGTPDETQSRLEIAVNEVTFEPVAQDNDSTSDEPATAPETTIPIVTDSLVNKSTFAPTIPQFSEFALDPPNPISQIDHSTSQRPAYDLILELLLDEADDLAGMAVQYSDLQNSQVSVALTPAMLEALEQMRSDIDQQHASTSMQLELVAGVGAVTSLSLTAGFVTWLLRTGSLLATALSTTPLWRKFDPIPVLANTNHFSTEGVEDSDV